MTYPHITNKLERRIVAGALSMFRKIPKQESKCEWYVFLSAIKPMVFDQCYIDVATWKLVKVEYLVYTNENKDEPIRKTIKL